MTARAHHHGHGHHHGQGPGHGQGRRALWLALGLNATLLVAEAVGGIVYGSLALLADAGHLLSDVAGLVIALVAARMALRPASVTHSYGWRRAEVLGAQANAATLLAVVVWVGVEAVRRLADPPPVDGGPVLIVATIGLAANLWSAVLLSRVAGANLNLRGAYLHMTADAAGSVGVIVAAVVVITTGARWADPVVSLGLVVLIAWSAIGLLRATGRVLLEATPVGLDPAAVEATLLSATQVREVHHLHLWGISSDQAALSGHVVLDGTPTLHDAQATGDGLKALLFERHGIAHATLELECHPCPAPDHTAPDHTAPGTTFVPALDRDLS